MKEIDNSNSRTPSPRLLLIAVFTVFFTIIAIILTHVLAVSSVIFSFIVIILSVVSIGVAIITMNFKDISALYQKLLHPSLALGKTSRVLVNSIAIMLGCLFLLGIATSIFDYSFSALSPLFTVIGIIISMIAITVFYFFYILLADITRPISTDTISYPPPFSEDFEVLHKEIVYEYLQDGRNLRQRKYLQLRTLKSGLTEYPDRYRWTGSGDSTIRSLTSGYTITKEQKKGLWNYFNIKFPHPLHKNDTLDFVTQWTLFDKRKRAVNFLSTMIDSPTEHLTLKVILPENLAPTRAYSYEFANYIDTLPIETNEIIWDQETKSLLYEVSHPKKYHKYLIRWYYD